ncbi:MAG: hypothetical protein SGJ09_15045, partial [Phycisphaerae bacterium]|nr:hypothetical protein [Phycisphaerae bacterium]
WIHLSNRIAEFHVDGCSAAGEMEDRRPQACMIRICGAVVGDIWRAHSGRTYSPDPTNGGVPANE